MQLDCNGKLLDLSRPQVMGVLNITPDSFSDGGDFFAPEKAIEQALRMQAEGAAIIDIGGESTRPGAAFVSVEDELKRVIPVIEALQPRLGVPISIDTQKPEVMLAAARAGAGFINDVNALRAPGALKAAAGLQLPICLMHMQGEPRTMQVNPYYDNVVADVGSYLESRVAACEAAGIGPDRIVLDPGFGFGKTVEHNLQLLAGLGTLVKTGFPVLVGLSRKSMIGKLLDLDVDERMPASIALAVLAVERGASIVRAHDVAETRQAIEMYAALRRSSQQRG